MLKYSKITVCEGYLQIIPVRTYAVDCFQLQGVPSGFDLMYLALADRNMQVRFGLKVVWES